MSQASSEASRLEFSVHPPGGWLRNKRNKFGITGPQLAAKMGVSKQRISALEKAELTGAASLKTMRQAADALGCEFVYALIPKREPGLHHPLIDQVYDPLTCMQSPQGSQHIADICHRFHIKHLGLYGSAARGELSEHSDVNLLAEFASLSHASMVDIEMAEMMFGRLFGKKVSLVSQAILDDPLRIDAVLEDLKIIYLS
ncbi:MAG: helix-turn-helix domain-containing protein [Mariprofundus sp.]|nr:helix-turn-helix domain-containing protein [Mariprofundus sp.]